MEKIVSDQDVAGMVWLLAKDGKVATFEKASMASIEDNIPMQLDSLFRIYSMTKPVTGVALMMLHEPGRFLIRLMCKVRDIHPAGYCA